MPSKIPFRSRSTKVKTPSAPSSSRKDGLRRSSSSAKPSSSRPSSSVRPSSPPDRLRPPVSSRRSRSHESEDRQPPPSTHNSYRPRPDDGVAGRSSSYRRDDYSPPRSRPVSPKRGRDRPPLSTWGRRDSNSSPYPTRQSSRPLSRPTSPRDDRSPQRLSRREEPEPERRGRSSSVRVRSPPRHDSRPPPSTHHHESSTSHHPEGTAGGIRESYLRRPQSEDRRGHTPERYRPSPMRHHSSPHSQSRSPKSPRSGHSSKSPHKRDSEDSEGGGGFFARLPGRLVSYAGFRTIAENADKAKEWIDYLRDLQGTPSEIHDLSAKAYTARDTITQIQQTLAVRPDLLEGESGQILKEQIEETIKSADETLVEMTKMLKQLTVEGTQEGGVMRGLEQYWNGHRYRNEFEDKVKSTDDKLQGELQQLSTLMVNVYSRALRKPPPPGLGGNIPPPAPQATAPAHTPVTTEAPERQQQQHFTPKQPEVEVPGHSEKKRLEERKDEPPLFKPQHPIPVVEVQPPTQTTDGDEADIQTDESPLGHVAPNTTSLHGLQFADCSPMLTPDQASPATDDDDQSVGDGLLPVAGQQKPAKTSNVQPPWPDLKPGARKSPDQSASKDAGQASDGHDSAEASEQRSSPNSSQHQRKIQAETQAQSQAQTQPQTQARASLQEPQIEPQAPSRQAVQQLLDAAWFGDIEGVNKSLLVTSPNVHDAHGLTPLHLACQRDHLAIAMLLVDRRASPSALASNERQPLHLAARYGSCATVEMLLEKAKADPNARTQDGRTPLHFAASSAEEDDEDRRDVIRVLRDWGANPEERNAKGETPRDTAQERGFWRAAGVLRRMEKRWEEEHPRRGSSAGHDSSPHGGNDEGRKGNWLQRHGLMK